MTDAGNFIARDFQCVAKTHEPIVGIINHNGRVLVAASNMVYELIDKTLVPLRFEMLPDEKQ